MLRQRKAFPVNFFENNITASAEKSLANFFAQAHGIVALAGFAQNFGSVGMGYERIQANAASHNFGEGADGNLAAAAEFVEQGALAGGGDASGSVVEKCQKRPRCRVAIANFNSQGALPGGGGHHFHGNNLADQLRFAEAVQASGGENDGIVVAGFELAQARIHIAAERVNLQIGTNRLQLRLTTQATGANVRPLRQRFDACELHGAKNVARIFASGDSGNFEIGSQLRRQIFQAVHSEINPVFDQGFLNFLGEHALGADFSEGNVGDFIAGGLDDLEFHGMALSAQQIGDVMGLPESELRAAGADAQAGHQSSASGRRADLEAVAPFSSSSLCRLKRRRTRSMTVVDSGSRAAVFRVLMGVCMILLTMPRVSASTASSWSVVIEPSRPRTRSISAWRMVSRWSCRLTMVGTTSRVCKRAWNFATSPLTIASAFSASFLRSATFISGSTSRGTAISIKNMGLLRRSAMSFSPCSRRKMKCGEPVEVITMSARSQVSYSRLNSIACPSNFCASRMARKFDGQAIEF